ncbi:MAG: pantoate--beta-alanine ligase [Crocinitomicaceae bacterium]|nr:pantoate--beta-alanine ligase [Flavobacteriales bacterium]NQZ35829.1 pantoate--beta-alanine ligase [Crocinitomicaceae bacterium]
MGDSQVFTSVKSLQKRLHTDRKNSSIGLFPTMGALHHGHIALVKQAMEENDVVVVSIFVNPTQFNNPDDLEKYPRMLEKDIELLNEVGDVIVFAPDVEAVYPDDFEKLNIDLGKLGETMEGEFRPGHFDGVMNVVKRFFDIVKPNRAYFGMKDYQQAAVIKHMVKETNDPVEVVICDIIREETGLASSSRNVRLSEKQKEEALIISQTLNFLKSIAGKFLPIEACENAKQFFKDGKLELEYLEIIHPVTLKRLETKWVPGAHACIVAYSGEVRLLDNIQLIPFVEK